MKKVCVTGASGYIGSHCVNELLKTGKYEVVGTVRDKDNEAKTKHLTQLEHASSRLTLVNADLVKESSFDEAVNGCDAVFHTASPVLLRGVTEEDYKQKLIEPALQGTLSVLRSCAKSPSVKVVVLTSSMAAVAFDGGARGSDHTYSEDDWSMMDYMEKNKSYYALSKTLAEKAAWEFAKDASFKLIVVNPTMVMGPMLQPSLNGSVSMIMPYLTGGKEEIPARSMSFIDVRDVANAHIVVLENADKANGRFFCVNKAQPWTAWCEAMQKALPKCTKIPTKVEDAEQKAPMLVDNSKLLSLGWQLTSLETSLKDTIATLISNGHLTVDQ